MSERELLLVEDDPGDVRLTREALRDCGIACQVHAVADGVEALRYLRGEGPYASARRPHLVLLDLNLPRRDGREVLREMKADPLLRRIPVVVLTTSDSADDVRTAYDLHANSYIRKPLDLDLFTATIASLGEYWFKRVVLPET